LAKIHSIFRCLSRSRLDELKVVSILDSEMCNISIPRLSRWRNPIRPVMRRR